MLRQLFFDTFHKNCLMKLIGALFMEKFRTEITDSRNPDSKIAIKQDGMREQLDWIRRQLEYATFSEKYALRYDLKRGEIYEFDWGINVNAEFSNRHYGVVLADSDIHNPLVTVCPLKSKHNGAHPKSDIDLGFVKCLNTENSTLAVINQIRTIDKLRIYTRQAIGRKDGQLSDSFSERYITIMRLEKEKVDLIINAYKSYLQK